MNAVINYKTGKGLFVKQDQRLDEVLDGTGVDHIGWSN